MSRAAFFPYPFAEGSLTVEHELGGDHLAETTPGRVQAEGVPESETIQIGLAVSLAPDTLERVLPEVERSAPPVAVVVSARSVSARRRELVRLEREDDQ